MAGLGDMFGLDYKAANGANTKIGKALLEKTGLNWPKGRDVLDLATNVPIAGDALSGGMALYDAAKGDYKSAGINALGVLPFVTAGTVKGVGKAADALSGKKLTEFEQRHLTAQKNAALPVEQGGLGLPLDNTAMQRAEAMGFDTPAFHGSDKSFDSFDPSLVAKNDYGAIGQGVYVDPMKDASYANGITMLLGNKEGSNIIPLKVRTGNSFDADSLPAIYSAERSKAVTSSLKDQGYDSVISNVGGKDNEIVLFDPSQVRSRFAAFDPMRRNEADLLGNINPQLLGAIGIGSVGTAAAATQLPDEYKSAIANAFSGR